MIGKIAKFGSRFLGALQYVYFGTKANRTRDLTTLRGELVFVQGLSLTTITDTRLKSGQASRLHIETMAEAMQRTASLNNRLQKPVWHQSFAFPPGEQPSNTALVTICDAFVETFGLANNQVLAFRHRDKNHDHIHIIANRIDCVGRTTAHDGQNYRRTAEFCRIMEAQLGLTPTRHLISEELDGKRRRNRKVNLEQVGHEDEQNQTETHKLRRAIIEARNRATNVTTFVEQLRQWGYAVVISERTQPEGERRVGIVYGKTFAGGTERWVRGSGLGPAYTYQGLLGFFDQKQAEQSRLLSNETSVASVQQRTDPSRHNDADQAKSNEVRLRFNA